MSYLDIIWVTCPAWLSTMDVVKPPLKEPATIRSHPWLKPSVAGNMIEPTSCIVDCLPAGSRAAFPSRNRPITDGPSETRNSPCWNARHFLEGCCGAQRGETRPSLSARTSTMVLCVTIGCALTYEVQGTMAQGLHSLPRGQGSRWLR